MILVSFLVFLLNALGHPRGVRKGRGGEEGEEREEGEEIMEYVLMSLYILEF